jgi:hypothetical protein
MVRWIRCHRAVTKARLFIRSLVSTLLTDSIRVRPRRILLELLTLFERGVLLEIGHFRGIIVSGRRLVVHAQAREQGRCRESGGFRFRLLKTRIVHAVVAVAVTLSGVAAAQQGQVRAPDVARVLEGTDTVAERVNFLAGQG